MQDAPVGLIVVHHQYAPATERGDGGQARHWRGLCGEGERKGKLTAFSDLALHLDLSAHEPDQALRDGEAESGSAVAARHRRVRLRELLEDRANVFGCNADARVADGESQLHVIVGGQGRRDRNDDLTLLRELDRVSDQVHQDLTEARRIPAHRAGHFGRDLRQELEMLFARSDREQARRRVRDLRDIEGNRFELEMFRLDLRIVEDVIQDHEQRFGRRAHQLQRPALFGRQLGIEDQLHETQHRVHRSANLVAHVREERGAGAGDALGEVAGLAHHRFGAFGGLLAHRQARASRHDRHSQREDGHDDRSRLVMSLIARGQ